MSDNKVIFINLDSFNGRSVELKVDGNQTWHALAEEFLNFLKGMGFQVDHQQVADYFAEYSQPVEVEDDLWSVYETDGGSDSNFGDVDAHFDFGDSAIVTVSDLDIGDITIETKDTK